MFGVSRFRTIVIHGRKERLGQQLDMKIVYLKHMPRGSKSSYVSEEISVVL